MIRGLRNLLEVSRAVGVERFVHLSSVAVYGDPPHPESVQEAAPTRPAPRSYGAIKLRQDEMVQRNARQGLRSLILCPPNISGPNSVFLLSLLAALQCRRIPLVEGGSNPCSLVDVDNLVHAIELSLGAEIDDGRRLFITDGETSTWRQIVDALAQCGDGFDPPDQIERKQIGSEPREAVSPLRAMKHLVSSDVRAILRRDPLLARIDLTVRNLVAKLPQPLEDRIRLGIQGPRAVPKAGCGPNYDMRLVRQQLRGVLHSHDRATAALAYRPVRRFQESMSAFCTWYNTINGVGQEDWRLARFL